MKVALLQQATRTTNGTQDWTDASVTNDLVAAIFFGTEATAAGNTASARMFVGCTDLVNNIAFSAGVIDATAAATHASQVNVSNDNCLWRAVSSGTITMTAAYSATLSNGVRINYPVTDGTAYLFNCLLISGADVEVKVSNVLFSTTDTLKTITHNCTGTPDIIMAFAAPNVTAFDTQFASLQAIIGLYDGTNQAGLGFADDASASPTSTQAKIGTGDFGHNIGFVGVDNYSITLSGVGASNFTATRSATSSSAVAMVFISIRHLSGTMVAKAGVTTLPTATGPAALVSGMAGTPQVLFTFPTRLISTAVAVDDTAGSWGMGIACNNNGTTQQGAVASTIKDAVTTTASRCQIYGNQAIATLDNTGASKVLATINSWDAGGVTPNYSAVNAAAVETAYLAFGIIQGAVVPSEYMTNMNYF